MRSDTDYGRLMKLWISLWTMVMEEKRHLETVVATLQRLVFEKQGYPQYKNWAEICKLGEIDHLMMMAVATLDLNTRTTAIEQIIAALPQCFSETEINGPYPLSLIRQRALELAPGYPDSAPLHPESWHAIPADVPLQGFDKTFDKTDIDPLGTLLPDGIDPNTPQGGKVIWEGREFVVLENNMSCQELWVAPAECIRVDL